MPRLMLHDALRVYIREDRRQQRGRIWVRGPAANGTATSRSPRRTAAKRYWTRQSGGQIHWCSGRSRIRTHRGAENRIAGCKTQRDRISGVEAEGLPVLRTGSGRQDTPRTGELLTPSCCGARGVVVQASGRRGPERVGRRSWSGCRAHRPAFARAFEGPSFRARYVKNPVCSRPGCGAPS